MSENTFNRADEANRRRIQASPHLKAALASLDQAIEAFGDWYPTDLECAHIVGRLLIAADIMFHETTERHEQMLRHANESLLDALLRHDDDKERKRIEDRHEPD